MNKKVSIILMAFCLILTACGQGGNTVAQASSLVEASSCVSSSTTNEIDYYEKYLKPLETSWALNRNWRDVAALLQGPCGRVGFLVRGLCGEAQCQDIWNKYSVKEDNKAYIPQEVAEEILTRYFNISAEEIRRLSPQYNKEKQAYEYDGPEITQWMNLKLITAEESGNTIVLHYEDYSLGGDATVMKRKLMIETEKDSFKYLSNAFDFKDDGSLDEQTKEALTFEQDIEPIAAERLGGTENKVIICIKDKNGNPVPGLRISFSGYTGYSIEGQNGQLRVFFPAIGCPPVFTKGKELYAYTDENGEYEWNGSCYTNKTLPERYWLDAGIEIEGVDYFKTSAVYFVDTMKDHGGGAYRYEYLWKYDERPEGK